MPKPGPTVTSGGDDQPGGNPYQPTGFGSGGGSAKPAPGSVGTLEIADGSVALVDLSSDVQAAIAAGGGGGSVTDATTSVKGVLRLANDLAGTATAPTVAKVNGVTVSGTPTNAGQILTTTTTTSASWQTPGGGGVADATTISKGVIQLSGDLAGTAASPTVPGLTGKVDATRQVTAGSGLTGGGDLTANRTLAVSYGTTAGTAAQGNDSRITGSLQSSSNLSDVANPATALSNLGAAPVSSPALTGTPTAPTATTGTSTTQIATTAFVQTAAAAVSAPDASTSSKGLVQLGGDLTGTAIAPAVAPGSITQLKLATNVKNALPLLTATTATAATVSLSAGAVNPLDATSNAILATLPDAVAAGAGAVVTVSKIDTSGNAVTIRPQPGGATPTPVGFAGGTANSVTLPAGIQANDIIVLIATSYDATLTAPTGYTLLAQQSGGGGGAGQATIWWKTAAGNESSTSIPGVTNNVALSAAVVRGVDGTTPFASSIPTAVTGYSLTHTPSSITTTTQCYVLFVDCTTGDTTGATVTGNPVLNGKTSAQGTTIWAVTQAGAGTTASPGAVTFGAVRAGSTITIGFRAPGGAANSLDGSSSRTVGLPAPGTASFRSDGVSGYTTVGVGNSLAVLDARYAAYGTTGGAGVTGTGGGSVTTTTQIAADAALTVFSKPSGVWSAATTYTVNQIVSYQNSTYRSLVSNTNITPSTDASTWELWGTTAPGVTNANVRTVVLKNSDGTWPARPTGSNYVEWIGTAAPDPPYTAAGDTWLDTTP